eukprot:TRINITY_DN75309_c0_g1_i1.p1 TRINITY_DN75309_c0_g1~~TRINITY_DN75309_c0_g1_i1.p1  ORF type:complete len:415 (+),score=54.82 TRINITY_DN75309_c0_g1_i1:55-1299(+)
MFDVRQVVVVNALAASLLVHGLTSMYDYGSDELCAIVLLQAGASLKRITDTSSKSFNTFAAPLLEDGFAQPACNNLSIVDAWRQEDVRVGAALDAWRSGVPDGSILHENIVDNKVEICMAQSPTDADFSDDARGRHVLTLVNTTEPPFCVPDEPNTSTRLDFEFSLPSNSTMAKLAGSRNVSILWPPDNKCSDATPCPVLIYFHGCFMEQPYLLYEHQCLSDLGSVVVGPFLTRDSDGDIEKWTDPSSDVLEVYVMPLIASLRASSYAPLMDWTRLAVAGSSLGAGMALQASLRYPDVIAAGFAIGLTDGSVCDFDSFDPSLFKVSVQRGARVAVSDWRLQEFVIVIGEQEDVVPISSPWRFSAALDLLRDSGITNRSAIHVRIIRHANHLGAIAKTWIAWGALYRLLWQGTWP